MSIDKQLDSPTNESNSISSEDDRINDMSKYYLNNDYKDRIIHNLESGESESDNWYDEDDVDDSCQKLMSDIQSHTSLNHVSSLFMIIKRFQNILLINIKYETYKSKYFIVFLAVVWCCIGVFYGILYEGWTIHRSFLFSLTAMASSGMPTPTCVPPILVNGVVVGDEEKNCLLGKYLIVCWVSS